MADPYDALHPTRAMADPYDALHPTRAMADPSDALHPTRAMADPYDALHLSLSGASDTAATLPHTLTACSASASVPTALPTGACWFGICVW